MKSLTPAEETLMHTLWNIDQGFLKDIMREYPDPKPHHNTVATVLKILVEKGFLKIKPFGRLHRYDVKVTKEQYYKQLLRLFIEEYYQNSPTLLLEEMLHQELLNLEDLKFYIDNKDISSDDEPKAPAKSLTKKKKVVVAKKEKTPVKEEKVQKKEKTEKVSKKEKEKKEKNKKKKKKEKESFDPKELFPDN